MVLLHSTNADNFHSKFKHQEWVNKLKEEVSRSSEAFIEHYREKYIGFPVLPIWMLTEVISLGSLSRCYEGLLHDDKKIISEHFSLHYKCLKDWLHKLTYIRNICAHHSRLWNKKLAIRPELNRNSLWKPPITPRNDRIFYILLILRILLKASYNGGDFKQQCTRLLVPIIKNKRWQIAMGIPDDWHEHPLWL